MTDQIAAIERLITLTPQPRWQRVLKIMQDQLNLPMRDVLSAVPGDSVAQKIDAIGCKRTTYYNWLHEAYRPSREQAKRLAELTGLAVDAIRGHLEDEHDAGRETAKTDAPVAGGRKSASGLHGRTERKRRRVVDTPVRSGSVRKVRRRTGKRPSGGK